MPVDLRHALRSILSKPGLSAIILATLALAIGVVTAIFSLLHAVVLQPLSYHHAERLVSLWETQPQQGLSRVQVSAATYLDWREGSKLLEGIAAYRYRGHVLTDRGEPERLRSVQVSPVLFEILGAEAAIGRTFVAKEETPGHERLVLLSHGAWTRRFGGEEILDATIRLDGEAHTVVGVMPEEFRFPPGDSGVELWVPLTLSLESLPSRPHRMYNAVGRLVPGVSLEQAQAEMDAIAAGIAAAHPDSNKGWGVTLVPVHEELVAGIRPMLFFLFGAVLLVLLIGCVNVANLLLTSSAPSQKDFAVRAAFGAGAWALARRALVESGLLALAGGASGVLLALGVVVFLSGVMPRSVPRLDDIGIDGSALLFALVVTVFSGLLFGIVPALRAMRPNLGDVLSTTGRSALGRRSRLFSGFLVVSEVALAVWLLVGSGLLIRSFARLLEVEPGFRKESVVSVAVTLPGNRYPGFEQQRPFYLRLLENVRALPGVESAGAVSALPLSSVGLEFDMPFTFDGLDVASPSERPRAKYRAATPGYVRAIGIPLLRGRAFDAFDRDEGRKVTMINEVMADRYFPDVDPLGQLLNMPMLGDMEIVGVLGNVRHYGLELDAEPEVFVPFVQLPLAEMHVVVHTLEDRDEMAQRVRREIHRLDPALAETEIATIEGLLDDSIAERRFTLLLLLGLGFSAVVMAAIGIYGVVAYSVAQRTGEIGLRMALGAEGKNTVALVTVQISKLLAVGLLAGLVGAGIVSRLIEGLLFAVEPTDPLTYLSAGSGVILLGVAAAALPALRAARIDPAEALREN